MTEGDFLLAALPQLDGEIKNRPVLALKRMPPFQDFLVCGVSSQLRHLVQGFDELITEADKEFEQTGLKKASVVRLGFLAVLPHGQFRGRIGRVSTDRLQRLRTTLADFLRTPN